VPSRLENAIAVPLIPIIAMLIGPLPLMSGETNVGVTSYDIYRDGNLLASSAPPAGYLGQSVQAGTTYSYSVVAKDAAGNARHS
jgi:hypothetical protein